MGGPGGNTGAVRGMKEEGGVGFVELFPYEKKERLFSFRFFMELL